MDVVRTRRDVLPAEHDRLCRLRLLGAARRGLLDRRLLRSGGLGGLAWHLLPPSGRRRIAFPPSRRSGTLLLPGGVGAVVLLAPGPDGGAHVLRPALERHLAEQPREREREDRDAARD